MEDLAQEGQQEGKAEEGEEEEDPRLRITAPLGGAAAGAGAGAAGPLSPGMPLPPVIEEEHSEALGAALSRQASAAHHHSFRRSASSSSWGGASSVASGGGAGAGAGVGHAHVPPLAHVPVNHPLGRTVSDASAGAGAAGTAAAARALGRQSSSTHGPHLLPPPAPTSPGGASAASGALPRSLSRSLSRDLTKDLGLSFNSGAVRGELTRAGVQAHWAERASPSDAILLGSVLTHTGGGGAAGGAAGGPPAAAAAAAGRESPAGGPRPDDPAFYQLHAQVDRPGSLQVSTARALGHMRPARVCPLVPCVLRMRAPASALALRRMGVRIVCTGMRHAPQPCPSILRQP